MNLSIELTAYPLEDEYLPIVEKYIKHTLKKYKEGLDQSSNFD